MGRRQARGPRPTAERTIRFYRVDAGQDQGGNSIPFDPAPPLRFLAGRRAAGDFYLERRDGRVLCAWFDSMTPPQRVRLANIRRNELPEVEEGGNLGPLPIRDTSGLAEHVHLRFFERNVVGAVFNFYGPRPSAFGIYHNEKTRGQFPLISVDPLLRPNALAALDRLEDVRMLRIKIRRSYLPAIEQADASLGRALREAMDAGEAQQAELTLTPSAYSRDSIGGRLLQTVRRLARRRDLRDEDVRALQVKGYDPEADTVEEIDILNAHIFTTKQIVKVNERDRTLDTDAAYRAIQDAYDELKTDIEEAASVFGY